MNARAKMGAYNNAGLPWDMSVQMLMDMEVPATPRPRSSRVLAS